MPGQTINLGGVSDLGGVSAADRIAGAVGAPRREGDRRLEPTLGEPKATTVKASTASVAASPIIGALQTIGVERLAQAIPRKMRLGKPVTVEIRIPRRQLETGVVPQNRGQRSDIVVTSAISIRLNAFEGAMVIDPIVPEVQWLESRPGVVAGEDQMIWRWAVRPLRRGRGRGRGKLQLSVSARTPAADGSMPEVALPDEVVGVTIQRNWGQSLARWAGWAIAAGAGAAAASIPVDVAAAVWTVVRTILKL